MVQWLRIHLPVWETQETMGSILGWEDPLEEEMAAHSSILAWKIPQTEKADWLYSQLGLKESDTTEHAQTLCLKYQP